MLTLLLRGARERRHLSVSQHEHAVKSTVALGKMIAGWIRFEREPPPALPRAPPPRERGQGCAGRERGCRIAGFVGCPCAARACAARRLRCKALALQGLACAARAPTRASGARRRIVSKACNAWETAARALAAQGQPRASTINVHAHSMHSPALAPAGAGRAVAGVGARARSEARCRKPTPRVLALRPTRIRGMMKVQPRDAANPGFARDGVKAGRQNPPVP
jgi:hypothetical protein